VDGHARTARPRRVKKQGPFEPIASGRSDHRPASNRKKPTLQKFIFNSSLPRAGSTLLQNIMAQNPRIYASPPAPVGVLMATRPTFTGHPAHPGPGPQRDEGGYKGFCRRDPGWYNRITDKPICLDKSRGWTQYYEWLVEFDPR